MPDLTIPAAHHDFLAAHTKGVLVTLRRNGLPQLSNVLYRYDGATGRAQVSVTADRAKTHNIAREPWVALHVSSEDFWRYSVAEGRGTLSSVAAEPEDEAVEGLVELYRSLAGEHPDWAEFRSAQVEQQRVLLTIELDRAYGAV